MKTAIEEEEMELEAMRKGDRSWHPCSVSLSADAPATLSVTIDSKNAAEVYDITSKDEVMSYLRFRSMSLQDGECSNVEEGEQVLAMDKERSKHLFYDAVVEKVSRVRHSKRVYCRCTFEVKWLDGESRTEAAILSSNLIMKLSMKSIDSYSIVAEFLNSLSSTSYTSNVEEGTPEADVQGLPEYDIQGLLEKQIEEISRIADSPSKISMEEIYHSKDVTEITASKTRSNLGSSTRSQRKTQRELDVKAQVDNASFLTPLAARAALASLVHELPTSSEISGSPGKKQVSAFLPSSFRDDDQAISSSTNPFFQEFGAKMPQDASETKSNVVHRQDIARSLHNSESKKKQDCQKSTRSTRSKAQNESQDSTAKIERGSNREEKKVSRGLSHLGVEKENEDDQVEEVRSKHRSKTKGPGKKLPTNLGEENKCSPISTVHQETINKCLIQDIQLDEFEKGHDRHVDTETNSSLFMPSSSNNADSLIKKGAKRTRLTNSTSNYGLDEGDIPLENKSRRSKPENGSSKKPPVRFSPRLRHIQSNGSHK